jgi:beta-fructofuranosidase
MVITARTNRGPAHTRGVVGHARSQDLVTWTVQRPLTAPDRFGHLEVPQVAVVDAQPLLLFCTNAVPGAPETTRHRVWAVPGPSLVGPWDLRSAQPFAHPHLYAPRLVVDVDGTAALIGFLDEVNGAFVGELTDPIPVRYQPTLGLCVASGQPEPSRMIGLSSTME